MWTVRRSFDYITEPDSRTGHEYELDLVAQVGNRKNQLTFTSQPVFLLLLPDCFRLCLQDSILWILFVTQITLCFVFGFCCRRWSSKNGGCDRIWNKDAAGCEYEIRAAAGRQVVLVPSSTERNTQTMRYDDWKYLSRPLGAECDGAEIWVRQENESLLLTQWNYQYFLFVTELLVFVFDRSIFNRVRICSLHIMLLSH